MPTILKQDEINRLEYDYGYTDKIMEICLTQVVRRFNRMKSILQHSSPKQIQDRGRRLYDKLDSDVRGYYSRIASHYHRRMCGATGDYDDWVDDYLLEYNPVTKVVFTNEVDRRAAKFIEAIISVDDIPKEVDIHMRNWSRFIRQYGDLVTDESAYAGMKKAGIKYVQWVTARDEKVCYDCLSLDGQIFSIDKLPDKPHPNCRCTVRAVKGQ